MSLFDLSSATPVQAARITACLDKQFRYSDGIRTLRAHLEARPLVAKKITDGMIDYSRTRFNRMDERAQAAYEAGLKAKRYYWAEDSTGVGHAVPKIVFGALTLPLASGSLAD